MLAIASSYSDKYKPGFFGKIGFGEPGPHDEASRYWGRNDFSTL